MPYVISEISTAIAPLTVNTDTALNIYGLPLPPPQSPLSIFEC